MSIVLDGTSGITTPDLASGPVAGTTGTFSGALQASGVATNIYPLVLATAVASTSGTSIDFTGIPSWVKRITVMFNVASTNGTSSIAVQIGAGSVDTTGYTSSAQNANNPGASFTTCFALNNGSGAANTYSGALTLSLLGSNTWVGTSMLASTGGVLYGSGTKTLSGTLDRVRITTQNGTDAFDAGTINIMYEG